MADIRYIVSVSAEGAVTSIQKLDDSFKKLGAEQQAAGKSADGLGSKFSGLWKQFSIGQIAVHALHKGWQLLKDQIGDSVRGAMEAEKANAALDAALMITGRSAANLGEHFKDYAEELMKATVYDDEAIKSTQALLVQLTNLDRQGIDQATRGAIGLASALGMDLGSAANIVAKAMAGNTGVLSRYGIIISETLPLEEKRAALLDKLEKLFGRATAETHTFSGQLAQLKNRWGEVQEAAGKFITQQQGVIDILNRASQAVLDYLTMNAELARATASQEEQENRRADWLGRAAAAAGWQYQEMSKLIETYHGVTPALLAAINAEKYGIEIKREYQRVIREEKAAWIELEAARKKAETGAGGGLAAEAKAVTDFIANNIPPFARTLQIIEKLPKSTKDWINVLKSIPTAVTAPMERLRISFQDILAAARQIMQSFDAVFSQAQKNREIGIDNEYKKRLAYINATIRDEAKRQAAITALEAEYQIKRSSAARAGAKQAKAVAMMEAIVNTADAVTKAYAQWGWPLGAVFGGILAALGAIQISLISKQPIPLAKGAVFSKRTLLPGPAYEVAEAGEPEFVAPKSAFKAAVREVMGEVFPRARLAFAGAGASVTVNMHAPLISSSGIARKDLEAAGTELLRQVNRQLRRVGRKA